MIGLCGLKGSGKTAAAEYLAHKYGFVRYSFATPVKQIASILGFPHSALNEPMEKETYTQWGISSRSLMQRIGTDFGRVLFPQMFPEYAQHTDRSLWLELMHQTLSRSHTTRFVIDDVRFCDEADYIRQNGGALIRVHRTQQAQQAQQKKNMDLHISETEGMSIDVDASIEASDLPSLYAQLDAVVHHLAHSTPKNRFR